MHPEILYEDNHVIIAVKPPNMPVQEDESGDLDMLTVLKQYIKEKYNKPGNVYLGLVHRLDRPVGGVMVFARTSKAAQRLSDAFAKKQAHKRYAAVVYGEALPRKSLECFMRKDEKTFSSHICRETDSGAKYAALNYRRTATRGGLSLLDIDLKTGRHHQIRVQLAGEGLPIYGAHRYNPAFINDGNTNIALFAYSLEIEHPTLHDKLRFSAVPKGDVWNKFSDELECMMHGAIPAYMDDNVVICDKPRGMSVAIDDGGDEILEEKLSYLPFAKPVHRIDATTEGLVLFARNKEAFDTLSSAISAHDGSVRKIYTCTVLGKPDKPHDTLRAFLAKDDEEGRVYVNAQEKAGSKEIITEYTVIRTYRRDGIVLSDLEINLITGRTHQIRAHMAYIGHPLVGDDKYGDRDANRQLHERQPILRSARIEFYFPGNTVLSYLKTIE